MDIHLLTVGAYFPKYKCSFDMQVFQLYLIFISPGKKYNTEKSLVLYKKGHDRAEKLYPSLFLIHGHYLILQK